jgi:uncharacterized membrane protein YhaH (DUF805 family)
VTTPSTPQPEPGWYPDPSNPSQVRYWDGAAWTAQPAQPQYPVAPAYPAQQYSQPAQDSMSLPDAVRTCLTKYVDFSGRARRSEYWWFALSIFIVYLVASLLGRAVNAGAILADLVGLGLFLPSLAVAVRRLHDTNRSGWFYLISLIPLVGGIILIVFLCQDSVRGPNRYGPSPKEA